MVVLIRCIAAAALLAAAGVARADSWAPPRVATYSSSSKQARLIVNPRPVGQLVDNSQPDQCMRTRGAERQSASAVLQRWQGGKWRSLWRTRLSNAVAPASAAVSDDGRYAVTFDNWGSLGTGDNAIVIYGEQGKRIASLGLTDFLSENYYRALPRSFSSIWWRGEASFSPDGERLVIDLTIPSRDRSIFPRRYVQFEIELATGRPVLPSGPRWEAALAAAAEVSEDILAFERKTTAWFEGPIRAPDSKEGDAWYMYLSEAFARTAEDWADNPAHITVLRDRWDPLYDLSEKGVSSALQPKPAGFGPRIFGSPSEGDLAAKFEAEAHNLSAGSLKGVRIYVAVGNVLRDRFAAALAHTGAEFIQIDPARPLPQRPERIAARNAPYQPAEEECGGDGG